MSVAFPDVIAELRELIQGAVITPADSAYENARAAWNLNTQHEPALIVEVASAADVVACVQFANAQGLGVAVQATGHGAAKPANADALLILTRGLNNVTVDPEAQTARIEAGVQWARVLGLASAHGLAPLLGSSPGVGAVGYTLGGGKGWLSRKYGMAVDAVLAFDVVTAQGESLRVSDTEHADLFWALRGGGGGNYAIVTAMEIRLFPVDQVYGGNIFYPIDQAKAVFQRYREWIADLPDEMTSSVLIMNFPPSPMVPDAVRGQSFVIVRGCYAGPLDEGQALVDQWRAWQAPVIDAWGQMPFRLAAVISQDPHQPLPGIASGGFMADLSDEAIDTLIQFAVPQAGPPLMVKAEVYHFGGAVARARREDMAMSHRASPLLLSTVSATFTPEEHAAVNAHLKALRQELGAHLTGTTPPNFVDGLDQARRVADMFEPDKYARLQAVKAAYDPNNLFRYGFGAPQGA